MAHAEASPERRPRGHAREEAPLRHQHGHGLRLVARNVRAQGGELDLVMRDGTVLVFVEVRFRASATFGGGAASVDAGKRRRLVLAAQAYLQAHPADADAPCRFDVIDASNDPDAPRIEWLRDAFRADDT
jgi:putative endonuclease